MGVNGEQYTASYTVSSAAVSAATAASHIFQLMAGSSLKVRVRRIEVYLYAVAGTAALNDFAVIRLSTAGTGGSAVTPTPLDPSDAASGATCMTLPSSKGTETVIAHRSQLYLMQTVAASAPLDEPILVIDFDRPRSKPLIIAAGTSNGICFKAITGAASASLTFTVWFDETSY